jgi:hypothetical protein
MAVTHDQAKSVFLAAIDRPTGPSRDAFLAAAQTQTSAGSWTSCSSPSAGTPGQANQTGMGQRY